MDYKDLEILKAESEEGRRLGFTAKVSSSRTGLERLVLMTNRSASNPSQPSGDYRERLCSIGKG